MANFHIVEPTLNNTSGHCFTLVHALAKEAQASMPNLNIHIWCGRDFKTQELADTGAQIHPYFQRSIRRIQLWNVLRKLAIEGNKVLLPTAGRSELAIYAMLPKRKRERNNIWFYLHQLRMDGHRAQRLAILGKRIPKAHILCTNPVLENIMQQAGFNDIKMQPYPFESPKNIFTSKSFKHLIFPGEIRIEKNPLFITQLIQYMHDTQCEIPIMIQAGPNHHGVFSEEISKILQSIRDIGYVHLDMPQRMLGANEYWQQFSGGICLQPYTDSNYTSRPSGVTLDSLVSSCPCITQQSTWSAAIIEEFSAGMTCKQQHAASWLTTIQQVIDHYSMYQDGCVKAIHILNQRHHPSRMLETIWGEVR